MQQADDLLLDSPKLLDYLGQVLAKLVLSEALPLSFLASPAVEELKVRCLSVFRFIVRLPV